MKSFVNFALFQGFWFAAILGAERAEMWWGPLACLAMFVLHLSMTEDRWREARFVLVAGLLGYLLDSGLHMADLIDYPSSGEAWDYSVAPPWIASLWFAFAMLPRFSLAWLKPKLPLALLLGAIGGPLSFYGGTRFDVIAPGADSTWIILALEYALVTPALLWFAPKVPRATGE